MEAFDIVSALVQKKVDTMTLLSQGDGDDPIWQRKTRKDNIPMALLSLESKAMQELCLGCKNVLTIKKSKKYLSLGITGIEPNYQLRHKEQKSDIYLKKMYVYLTWFIVKIFFPFETLLVYQYFYSVDAGAVRCWRKKV